MLGGTYLLPLYMQRGLDYTALMAGSVFLPVGLIQGVLSAVSGYMTRYVKPLLLVVAGILVMALSFWLASRFTLHTTHRHILFVLYLRGLGMGLTFAPPEPLFAQKPHPGGHGRSGRHLEQHQAARGQFRHRHPHSRPRGPHGLPHGARNAPGGPNLCRRGHRRAFGRGMAHPDIGRAARVGCS